MAKRSTHIDSIFEEHKEIVSKYEDSMSNSVNRINKAIENSVRNVENSLGDIDEMNKKFRNNKALADMYERYKESIELHTELTESMGEASQSLMKKFELTSEELGEVLDLIAEQEKLDSEIKDHVNKRNSAKKQSTKDWHDKLIQEKTAKRAAIEQKIVSNVHYSELANDYRSSGSRKSKSHTKSLIKDKQRLIQLNDKIIQQEKALGAEIDVTNDKIDAKHRKMDLILKLTKSVVGSVKELGKKWIEVDEIVTKYGRSVGVSSEQTKAYRKNVLDNFGEMAGRLGMTVQEVIKFQEQYAKNTGKAIILTNRQVESLAGLSKIAGEVATDTMVKNMDDFGSSVDNASGYLAQTYARASQVGLNAAKTSEAFANNIKMASKYTFKNGLDSISKMTLLSQRLKINMESMSNALDKFSTIEGAISTSANLQILGGNYANQFYSPLQALGESLLDPEAFIQRIIDTFTNNAVFNRKTGIVEASQFEKQRMKLAAKELGLNYDDVWKMVSQNQKAVEVDRQLQNATTLDAESKEYLRNMAQFDTSKNDFYVSYYDKNGEEKQQYLSEIKTNEQVQAIRRTTTKDDVLKSDVHDIRDMLAEYIDKQVGSMRTTSEILKGIDERYKVGGANLIDKPMSYAKQGLGALSTAGSAMFGIYGVTRFLSPAIGTVIGNKRPSRVSTISSTRTSASSSRTPRGGIGNLNASLMKYNKGIKIGGSLLSAGYAAYGVYNANKDYKNAIRDIDSNTTMSNQEKIAAKSKAKVERNTSRGKSVGSGVGAIIGGAIGSLGGPVGTLIGGAIGGAVGDWIGGKVGSSKLFNKNKPNASGSTSNIAKAEINEQIGKDVHGIYNLLASNNLEGYQINNNVEYNHALNPQSNNYTYGNYRGNDVYTNNLYSNFGYGESPIVKMQEALNVGVTPVVVSKPTVGNKTYVRQDVLANNNSNSNIKIDPLNLTVNGSIKLVGDKNVTAQLDMNKLFNDVKFKQQIVDLVVNSLNEKSNMGMAKDRNTVYSITNGSQSLSSQNHYV